MELKLLPDYHSGFLIEAIRLEFVEGLFLVLNINFDLDIMYMALLSSMGTRVSYDKRYCFLFLNDP